VTDRPDSHKAENKAQNRKYHCQPEGKLFRTEITSCIDAVIQHYCGENYYKQEIQQYKPYLKDSVIIKENDAETEHSRYQYHHNHGNG